MSKPSKRKLRKTRQERQRREQAHRVTWTKWQKGVVPSDIRRVTNPDECWVNNIYQVLVYRLPKVKDWPDMIWLSVKRHDQEPIREWRHLQKIKNELVGKECEGVELFPAESRLIDTSNQFHMFVLVDPTKRFPFGFEGRMVVKSGPSEIGSKQQPFDDIPPDAISSGDADEMVKKALAGEDADDE